MRCVKGVCIVYQYQYIYCEMNRLFSDATDYREVIDKMAAEGWRFVTFIPSDANANGVIKGGDLIFEREIKD